MDEKPPGKYNAPDLEVIFLVQYTALGSACLLQIISLCCLPSGNLIKICLSITGHMQYCALHYMYIYGCFFNYRSLGKRNTQINGFLTTFFTTS